MDQLQILDLTQKEAKGNMELMQMLRKERHDKKPRIKNARYVVNFLDKFM